MGELPNQSGVQALNTVLNSTAKPLVRLFGCELVRGEKAAAQCTHCR